MAGHFLILCVFHYQFCGPIGAPIFDTWPGEDRSETQAVAQTQENVCWLLGRWFLYAVEGYTVYFGILFKFQLLNPPSGEPVGNLYI